jgi:hypothetical protein
MSLITNEIHILDGFRKTILVFGADRMITTRPGGKFHSLRKKLFRIPYLNAGISYFGLAAVYPNGREQYLSDWLPSFINRHANTMKLREFAESLQQELNAAIPARVLKANPSGFHICGYRRDGVPEFWFVRNIGSMDTHRYFDLLPQYQAPTSDFLERDAISLGWDGTDPSSVRNVVQIYRNGDIRAHVSSWEKLDSVLAEMSQFQDMRKLKTPEDLSRWVKFKFRFIAAFYKEFAKHQIIGGPIDVFALTSPRS